jgi:hypothetical protein
MCDLLVNDNNCVKLSYTFCVLLNVSRSCYLTVQLYNTSPEMSTPRISQNPHTFPQKHKTC